MLLYATTMEKGFTMEYIILNVDAATEEQLRAAIDCNNRTYKMMISEIAKLKRVADSAKKVVKTESLESETTEVELPESTKDDDFEDEVETTILL